MLCCSSGLSINMYNFLKRIYRKLLGVYNLSSLLSKEIEDEWKILDVGCGRTSSLKGVEKGAYRVGLDIYRPYILKSRKLSVHDYYVLADARALPFKCNSFDCAVATEILEHLTKHDGLRMIKEMERVVKKKILMTTPNGFLPTYAGPDDNPEETHLCGYTADELKKLGFRVWGFHGLKTFWTIKHGQSVVKFRLPKILSTLLIDITELFVYHFPSLAFQFFFVKDLSKRNKRDRSSHEELEH